MKKLLLLLTILIPSVAFAQALPIRNDTPTTLRDLGANLNVGRNFAVNQYGQMQCSLAAGTASATNPIKLEDSAAASGDAGVQMLGVANTAFNNIAAADDYTPIATVLTGAVQTVILTSSMSSSQQNASFVKNEDGAFSDTNALALAGGVNNRSVTAYNTTNGDVTPIGVNDYGGVFCDLDPRYSGNTIAPNQREDTAFADQNGVMIAGGQSLSAIAQSVGTSGDVAPIAMDLGNRLVTTNAPAGETWQICAAAVTDTTQRTIKGSVVSNRIYVTDITCTNEANVSSVLSFRDGSSEVWRGRVASTTLEGIGYFMYNFEIPLRLTSATAFTFAALTTGTNTTCCAGGYISTI